MQVPGSDQSKRPDRHSTLLILREPKSAFGLTFCLFRYFGFLMTKHWLTGSVLGGQIVWAHGGENRE